MCISLRFLLPHQAGTAPNSLRGSIDHKCCQIERGFILSAGDLNRSSDWSVLCDDFFFKQHKAFTRTISQFWWNDQCVNCPAFFVNWMQFKKIMHRNVFSNVDLKLWNWNALRCFIILSRVHSILMLEEIARDQCWTGGENIYRWLAIFVSHDLICQKQSDRM